MVMYAFSSSGIQRSDDVHARESCESVSNGVRTQWRDWVVVDETGKRESTTSLKDALE